MLKWEVYVRCPLGDTIIAVGIRQKGYIDSFTVLETINLDTTKESSIHYYIEQAVGRSIKRRDELNHKLDLVKQELICYGKEITWD